MSSSVISANGESMPSCLLSRSDSTFLLIASTLHGVSAASCTALRYSRPSFTHALRNEPGEPGDRLGDGDFVALVPCERVPVDAELGGELRQ